jgi:type II secretory pathway component PulF
MPDTLENMANELEKFELIKKKLKSAMMYPSVVIVVAIFAVIILLVKVIPGILTIFPPDLELPFVTRAVMAVSDYLKVNYDIVVSLIILIPILFSIAYKNLLIVKKYIDKLLLQIPVIGPLTKTFYRYRFSKLL